VQLASHNDMNIELSEKAGKNGKEIRLKKLLTKRSDGSLMTMQFVENYNELKSGNSSARTIREAYCSSGGKVLHMQIPIM